MEGINTKTSDTYFSVHSFMTDGLDLSGAELLIYALIYSFSDTEEGFHGSQDYISQRTGICKRTVRYTLSALVKKCLLEKSTVAKKAVYKAIVPDSVLAEYAANIATSSGKYCQNERQNLSRGEANIAKSVAKNAANNKDYNKHYNKDYNSAHGGARKSPKKEWGFEESNWKNPEWVEAVFEQALARSYAEYDYEESPPADGKA